MSEIYRMVLEGDHRNVRIAFVGREPPRREWRRVTRQPRLSLLPLSEFKLAIVTWPRCATWLARWTGRWHRRVTHARGPSTG